MDITSVSRLSKNITENVGKVIFGKRDQIELIVISLIAGGHVLLDDIPGTGKTTLARARTRRLAGKRKILVVLFSAAIFVHSQILTVFIHSQFMPNLGIG